VNPNQYSLGFKSLTQNGCVHNFFCGDFYPRHNSSVVFGARDKGRI